MYKIKLYNRAGDTIGERYTRTLQAAETIRMKHGENIGLDPNRAGDFGRYPTIWEKTPNGYKRVSGY